MLGLYSDVIKNLPRYTFPHYVAFFFKTTILRFFLRAGE